MASDEVREDRRYTDDHEWAKLDGDEVTIGITAYAVDQLGEITLLNLDVNVGDEVEAKGAFGTIESVKTLSDLFAPIGGKIVAINEELLEKPEAVNDDCYEAWMVRIAPANKADVDGLMDKAAYEKLLASLD